MYILMRRVAKIWVSGVNKELFVSLNNVHIDEEGGKSCGLRGKQGAVSMHLKNSTC